MHLRALIGTRPAANFRADRREPGTGCNTLEHERPSAINVVNSHCVSIHGLPLPVNFSIATENAV
jgi:hypothetical protein